MMKGVRKVKTNVKIISLAVSMLLLVGAVIGISAFADTSPTVEIAQKNISYEGAVKTLYAVKTANADGYTVQVNFYDTDPAAEGAVPAYTKGVGGQITVGEEPLDVVFSKGFSPEMLRKSIFAVPTLVDANGAVVATGAAVEYSPYIYAMNRFSQSATADQLSLYTALLDYGAAVQRVLCTADEVTANGGYADEYYDITANKALATDLAGKSALVSGTYSKADLAAGEIVADAAIDNIDFAAWADADGNAIRFGSEPLTAQDVKPGKNTLTAVYGYYGDVATKSSDFSSDNSFVATVSGTIPTKTEKASHNGTVTEGTSAVAITDGKLVYNKRDADWQWMRFYGQVKTYAEAFYFETKIKFENVKGTNDFTLFPETWNDGYSSIAKVAITPNDNDVDENGYVRTLTLGSATLNAGTEYTVRVEYNRAAKTIVGYVDGEAAYVKYVPDAIDNGCTAFRFAAETTIENADVYFDDASFGSACLHNAYGTDLTSALAVAGSKTFYKLCSDCALPDVNTTFTTDGSRGEGVYYNDQTMVGTKYDMSAIPSRKYYTANQTWAINDGALSITSHGWAPMSIRPTEGTMTAAAGQKYVVEFDIMYSGSSAAADNASPYVFAGLAYAEKGTNNTQSPSFYWNSKYNEYMTLGGDGSIVVANGVWYNFRYEYTVNADGSASYVTYVNNEAVDTLSGTVATAITESYGWSICGRVCGDATVNLDNMYLGVICAEHNYIEKEVLDAYAFDGEFYKSCSACGKLSEETFTVDTDAAKGTGTYFADETINSGKADVENTAPTVTWGKNNGGLAYDLNDGTLNITSISWAYLTFASNSAVTLAAGEKFVQEFDFMYDGATDHPTDKNGRVYATLSSKATGSNSSLISNAGDSIYTTAKYAYIGLEGGTNNKTKLLADIWYNIRAEYIVSDDGASATYNIYVNGVLDSTITDTSPATAIAGWLMQPSRQASETLYFKFDNFYMSKICAEHSYVDIELSGTAFKEYTEAGVPVFYKQSCSKCGNFAAETYEYAGVTLGQGTYYADATKDGKREDYENITVGTSFDQALNGTNTPTTSNLYSIVDNGETKGLNLKSTAWSTAAVRPHGETKITFATGDKLVMEFDLRIDESYHADKIAAKLNFANTYKASDSKMVSDQIALKVADNGKDTILGTTTLVKGVWYNVRFELTVGGDLSIYVNGDHSQTTSGYSYAWSEMAWYGLGIVTRGTLDMTIDNMYMANTSAVTETTEATEQ